MPSRIRNATLAVLTLIGLAACDPPPDVQALVAPSTTSTTAPPVAPAEAPLLWCAPEGVCRFAPPEGVVHDGFKLSHSHPEAGPWSIPWYVRETEAPAGTVVRVRLCNGPSPYAACGPAAEAVVPEPPDPYGARRFGATGAVNGYPCGGQLPTCRVLACESGGNPYAENPSSSASGLWQIIDGTWDGYAGVRHASHAHPLYQNEKAAELWAGGAGAGHWRSCL